MTARFGQHGEIAIYEHDDGIHSDVIDWPNGRQVATIEWLPELRVHEMVWGALDYNVNFSDISRLYRWIDQHSDVVVGGLPW